MLHHPSPSPRGRYIFISTSELEFPPPFLPFLSSVPPTIEFFRERLRNAVCYVLRFAMTTRSVLVYALPQSTLRRESPSDTLPLPPFFCEDLYKDCGRGTTAAACRDADGADAI